MIWSRRTGIPTALAVLALAGCALRDAGEAADPDTLRLRFEETVHPEIFLREALGRRASSEETEGLWAVVPDLPRPERAEVRNLRSGARVRVALFAAEKGADADEVRLSPAAADVLGIAGEPVPVRITALRRDPRILQPRGAGL